MAGGEGYRSCWVSWWLWVAMGMALMVKLSPETRSQNFDVEKAKGNFRPTCTDAVILKLRPPCKIPSKELVAAALLRVQQYNIVL